MQRVEKLMTLYDMLYLVSSSNDYQSPNLRHWTRSCEQYNKVRTFIETGVVIHACSASCQEAKTRG
jgi:hypothetical protein